MLRTIRMGAAILIAQGWRCGSYATTTPQPPVQGAAWRVVGTRGAPMPFRTCQMVIANEW